MKVYYLFSQMMQLIQPLLLSRRLLQRSLDLIVQDSHLFHQKREENLNKAGMKNINGFYMTARKKKFFVLPALKLPK